MDRIFEPGLRDSCAQPLRGVGYTTATGRLKLEMG